MSNVYNYVTDRIRSTPSSGTSIPGPRTLFQTPGPNQAQNSVTNVRTLLETSGPRHAQNAATDVRTLLTPGPNQAQNSVTNARTLLATSGRRHAENAVTNDRTPLQTPGPTQAQNDVTYARTPLQTSVPRQARTTVTGMQPRSQRNLNYFVQDEENVLTSETIVINDSDDDHEENATGNCNDQMQEVGPPKKRSDLMPINMALKLLHQMFINADIASLLNFSI